MMLCTLFSERASSKLLYPFDKLADGGCEFAALGGRDPFQRKSFGFQAEYLQETPCGFDLLLSSSVTESIVAIADMTT
jgi:hypothetical protein